MRAAGTEEGQDGNDSAVVRRCVADAELAEDAADVTLERLWAQVQPIADSVIRMPLGHQGEYLSFTRRQIGEWPGVAAVADKARHDGRVNDALALVERRIASVRTPISDTPGPSGGSRIGRPGLPRATSRSGTRGNGRESRGRLDCCWPDVGSPTIGSRVGQA